MGFSKLLGTIFNFIIVGMIGAAIFGGLDWSTVAIATAIMFAISFASGVIEGSIQRKKDESDALYSEKIFNAIAEKHKRDSEKI